LRKRASLERVDRKKKRASRGEILVKRRVFRADTQKSAKRDFRSNLIFIAGEVFQIPEKRGSVLKRLKKRCHRWA